MPTVLKVKGPLVSIQAFNFPSFASLFVSFITSRSFSKLNANVYAGMEVLFHRIRE